MRSFIKRIRPTLVLCTLVQAGALLSFATPLFGKNAATSPPLLPQEVIVDLRSPTYQDGVLSTKEGGILLAEGIRIQAREISYKRSIVNGKQVSVVTAEGDLMIQYGKMVLVGRKIEYDFSTQSGILYKGRSAVGKWYVGGERLILRPDRSLSLEKAYVTTCENAESEWQLGAGDVTIRKDSILTAKSVNVRFFKIPIFWLPNVKMNLKSVVEGPIRYKAAYRGREGSVISARYRFFTWKELNAFVRLDYVTGRGPGGGIETEYDSISEKTHLYTQNYAARDNSIDDPRKRFRYRFGGHYQSTWDHKRYDVDLRYDKLSDSEMPTDYHIDDFHLYTARRTQLRIHRQEKSWIANLFTRVRLNSFQTINQELPSVETSWRPLNLDSSGIIYESRVRLSYLDYVFAKETEASNFHSGRFAMQQTLSRPFSFHYLRFLPQAELVGIAFTDSPQHNAKFLGLGRFGMEVHVPFSRMYPYAKHIVLPYARYEFVTTPTVSIPEHFLFSIDDAYLHMESLRFGMRNTVYQKDIERSIFRAFYWDVYSYAFFHAPAIPVVIQKAYSDLIWTPLTRTYCSIQFAWNIEHGRLEHINTRIDYTYSPDIAFAIEYRIRDKYDWRKADKTNFVLDAFNREQALLVSPVSDRRQTFLTHCFLRITSSTAIELQTRHGWDRRFMPAYNEGKITVSTVLACRWYLKVYYEHAEYDNRYGLSLALGTTGHPRKAPPSPPIW
jgi:hypothetical protein